MHDYNQDLTKIYVINLQKGNYYNQAVLFDCQIVDAFNRILQLPESIDCSLVDVSFTTPTSYLITYIYVLNMITWVNR